MYARLSKNCDRTLVYATKSIAKKTYDKNGEETESFGKNGAKLMTSTTEVIGSFAHNENFDHADISPSQAEIFEVWRAGQLDKIRTALFENALAGKLGGVPTAKEKAGNGSEKIGEFAGNFSMIFEDFGADRMLELFKPMTAKPVFIAVKADRPATQAEDGEGFADDLIQRLTVIGADILQRLSNEKTGVYGKMTFEQKRTIYAYMSANQKLISGACKKLYGNLSPEDLDDDNQKFAGTNVDKLAIEIFKSWKNDNAENS
jgi:hypothetical protein